MVVGNLVCNSRVRGSGIGSIEATQAVIDLCAAHNIAPEISVLPVDKIAHIYEQLASGNDAGTRFVLDMGTLDDGAAARLAAAGPPKLGAIANDSVSVGKMLSAISGMLFLGRWW